MSGHIPREDLNLNFNSVRPRPSLCFQGASGSSNTDHLLTTPDLEKFNMRTPEIVEFLANITNAHYSCESTSQNMDEVDCSTSAGDENAVSTGYMESNEEEEREKMTCNDMTEERKALLEQKQQRKRERNRMAAAKCRSKKVNKIAELEQENARLKSENLALRGENDFLKSANERMTFFLRSKGYSNVPTEQHTRLGDGCWFG